jgi:hypothetical protein
MVPMKKDPIKKKEKPIMPPDQKVAHLLATLLASSVDFDADLATIMVRITPTARRMWHQAKMELQLLKPVQEAMESGDPQRVLKAIYQRPGALEILNTMGKQWQAQEDAEAAKPAPTVEAAAS